MGFLKLQAFYTILARLSKREKIILYSAIFFISLSLLDRSIIYPIASKIESLNKEIQDKKVGIAKNLRILAQKDRILAESAKYASFLNSPKTEEEQMSSLLKEIESLANKSSVYLVDLKPAGLRSAGSVNKYSINLNCEAQMEQLAEFMYNIENSNSLLSIDRYQISPKSKESSVAKCSMSIGKIVVSK